MSNNIKTSYLNAFFELNTRKRLIENSVAYLNHHIDEFDAIVVRGVSGLSVGSIVAHILNKPLVVIRKPGSSHYNSCYEGPIDFSRYLVIDDFYRSGGTLTTIRDTVQEYNEPAICSLVYFYIGQTLSQTDANKVVRDIFGPLTKVLLNKLY